MSLSYTTRKNLTLKRYENKKKWIMLQDLLYKVKINSFSGKNERRKFRIRPVDDKESNGREMARGL